MGYAFIAKTIKLTYVIISLILVFSLLGCDVPNENNSQQETSPFSNEEMIIILNESEHES